MTPAPDATGEAARRPGAGLAHPAALATGLLDGLADGAGEPKQWRGVLIVDSQGPWAGPGSARLVRDAAALAATVTVWLWLVGDGISSALPGAGPADGLRALSAGPGGVWVDGFSLARRGLGAGDLVDGVTVVEVGAVAELLLQPDVKAVWR
jgi:hypothetical protein